MTLITLILGATALWLFVVALATLKQLGDCRRQLRAKDAENQRLARQVLVLSYEIYRMEKRRDAND